MAGIGGEESQVEEGRGEGEELECEWARRLQYTRRRKYYSSDFQMVEYANDGQRLST
jgi:hypothetical protein